MIEHPTAGATTILIVDDEPSIRKLLKRALRRSGRRLVGASNGHRALILASRQKVDVVLLDLKMPGMSGIRVLERLLEVDPGMVVIVITAYGSIETARQAMRLGAYEYLTKPFDMDLVEQVIDDGLHLKQRIPVDIEQ